jgi:serine/threonine-protein kinase RsbW
MPEAVSSPSQEADHLAALPAEVRQWRRVFPGHNRELSQLRRWLCSLLPSCPERDELLSVASELGSNAQEHTASGNPGGSFTVEVAWHRSMVHVAVTDSGSPGEPRVIEEPDGEHGRGLLLVHGLSARTGWTGDERGRVVWAQIAWPDNAGVVQDAGSDRRQVAAGGNRAVLVQPFEDGAHPAAHCCCHVFTPTCPVDCLAAVLSTATFHALARADGAPFGLPTTVGQVLELRRAGQLSRAAAMPRRGPGSGRPHTARPARRIASLTGTTRPQAPDPVRLPDPWPDTGPARGPTFLRPGDGRAGIQGHESKIRTAKGMSDR